MEQCLHANQHVFVCVCASLSPPQAWRRWRRESINGERAIILQRSTPRSYIADFSISLSQARARRESILWEHVFICQHVFIVSKNSMRIRLSTCIHACMHACAHGWKDGWKNILASMCGQTFAYTNRLNTALSPGGGFRFCPRRRGESERGFQCLCNVSTYVFTYI